MKRAKKISLTLSYIASFVLVIFATYILVKLAQGNVLDIFSGRLKPTGLLLTDSTPDGGEIFINDKAIKAKTPRRITSIEPGSIKVKYTKAGYRDWSNINEIIASEVTFLTYAWLIPNDVETTQLLAQLKIQTSLQSKDYKRTVMVNAAPSLSVYSTTDFEKARELFTPVASADPNSSIVDLSLKAISDDGDRVIVSALKANNSSEILFLDTNTTTQNPTNLTTLFRVSAQAELQFNPDNNQELIWLEGGLLRKINVTSRNVSSVIAENVTTTKVANKKIYYLQSTPTNWQLYHTNLGGEQKTIVLTDIDPNGTYVIDGGRYNSEDSIALLNTKTSRLSIYLDRGSDPVKQGKILENVTNFTFNKTGRFLAIDQANKLTTYDFEKEVFRNYGADIVGLKRWVWLDEFHLSLLRDRGVEVVDFDGQNQQLVFERQQLSNNILVINKNPAVVLSNPNPQLIDILVSQKR